MEINNKIIYKFVKEVILYIFRVIVFIVLNNFYVCLLLTIILYNSLLNKLSFNINTFTKCSDICYTIIFYIIEYIYVYLTAKICGIYKKLDKLKFIWALITVIFINILFYFNEDYNVSKKVFFNIGYFWKPLICFLIYKFFGFLAKKFPFPFAKIGYYTSIDFIIDILFKIKRKCKNQ